MPDVCIISGGDHRRQALRSPVNHKIYATLAGLDYRFEVGPYRDLSSPYYFKLEALRTVLPRYDWVVWIDDDAFVTDMTGSFEPFIEVAESAGKCLVVADSPLNSKGESTRLNSGVLLVKNCAPAIELLSVALGAKLAELKATWNASKNGRFSNGDQDALVWAIETTETEALIDIVDHRGLNARVYEYSQRASDHFVCHFAGVPHKRAAIRSFAARFGLDESLVPPEILAAFAVPVESGMTLLASQIAEARARVVQSDVVRGAIASRERRKLPS